MEEKNMCLLIAAFSSLAISIFFLFFITSKIEKMERDLAKAVAEIRRFESEAGVLTKRQDSLFQKEISRRVINHITIVDTGQW